MEESVTLYAIWVAEETYTFSIVTNGGTPEIDPVEVPVGADLITYLPAEYPTKDGFTFDGFYSDIDLTIQYVFGEMPSEDVTLYIKWV